MIILNYEESKIHKREVKDWICGFFIFIDTRNEGFTVLSKRNRP